MLRQFAGNAVYFGRLQRLMKAQRRQDGREPSGKHSLTGARRTNQDGIVTARGSNFKRPLDAFLAFYITEIEVGRWSGRKEGGPCVDDYRAGSVRIPEKPDDLTEVTKCKYFQLIDYCRLI